jgi:hypothetical protein
VRPPCPRCGRSDDVVHGGVTGRLWLCRSCLRRSMHLERARVFWRLSERPDQAPADAIRVMRKVA